MVIFCFVFFVCFVVVNLTFEVSNVKLIMTEYSVAIPSLFVKWFKFT